MDALKERLERAMTQRLQIQVDRLESPARLLMSLSYERSLERGFAVVRDEKGRLVSAGEKIKSGAGLEIQFKDRRVAVVAAGSSAKLKAKPKKTSNDQGMLL
jgi:exodeoxyribonuclease VII large subunit